jgi:hypothetical protein
MILMINSNKYSATNRIKFIYTPDNQSYNFLIKINQSILLFRNKKINIISSKHNIGLTSD